MTTPILLSLIGLASLLLAVQFVRPHRIARQRASAVSDLAFVVLASVLVGATLAKSQWWALAAACILLAEVLVIAHRAMRRGDARHLCRVGQAEVWLDPGKDVAYVFGPDGLPQAVSISVAVAALARTA